MRYHYEEPSVCLSLFGETYICDHPVYHSCTLYKIRNKGLAVVQQRFDPKTKATWWSEVDSSVVDAIYTHPRFLEFFNERAGESIEGLYPSVSVRQIMWALKMKPIKRERWETVFDRRLI